LLAEVHPVASLIRSADRPHAQDGTAFATRSRPQSRGGFRPPMGIRFGRQSRPQRFPLKTWNTLVRWFVNWVSGRNPHGSLEGRKTRPYMLSWVSPRTSPCPGFWSSAATRRARRPRPPSALAGPIALRRSRRERLAPFSRCIAPPFFNRYSSGASLVVGAPPSLPAQIR